MFLPELEDEQPTEQPTTPTEGGDTPQKVEAIDFNAIAESTAIDEGYVTPTKRKALRDFKEEQGVKLNEDRTFGQKVQNVAQNGLKVVVDTVQGAENMANFFVQANEGALEYAVGKVSDLITGEDTTSLESVAEDKKKDYDKLHKDLQVSAKANNLIGGDVFHSWDKFSEEVDNTNEKLSDNIGLGEQVSVVAADIAGYVVGWETMFGKVASKALTRTVKEADKAMLKGVDGATPSTGSSIVDIVTGSTAKVKGIATDAGAGGIAKVATLGGVQQGMVSSGEGKDVKQILDDAAVATLIGGGVMTALKSTGLAVRHIKNATGGEGTKVLKGFEELATKSAFKGDVKGLRKTQEEFGKVSAWGSWDNMPTMMRIAHTASLSKEGRFALKQAMGNPEEGFEVSTLLANMADADLKKVLGSVNDTAEIGSDGVANLHKKLISAGFTKDIHKADSGVGSEWQALSAVMSGKGKVADENLKGALAFLNSANYHGTEAQQVLNLGTILRDAQNGAKVEPTKVKIKDFVDDFLHRLSVRIADPDAKVFKSMDEVHSAEESTLDVMLRPSSTDMRRNTHSDLALMVEDAINSVSHTNTSKGEASITPSGVYNIYLRVRDGLSSASYKETKGDSAKIDAMAQKALVDMLDSAGMGAEYKEVLNEAIEAHKIKMEAIDVLGLGKVLSNQGMVSSDEVRLALKNMGLGSKDFEASYKKMMESLTSTKAQVDVETSILKALVVGDKRSLANIVEGNTGTPKDLSEALAKQTGKVKTDIDTFKPLTREGRVLKESLLQVVNSVDGIIRATPTTPFERSLLSSIMVGINKVIGKYVGTVQSAKGSAQNYQYVSHKIAKLAESMSEADLRKGLIDADTYVQKVRSGMLSEKNPNAIAVAGEINRMKNNLAKLKAVDDSSNGVGLSKQPNNPTPPTPVPPSIAKDLIESGEINQLTPRASSDFQWITDTEANLAEEAQGAVMGSKAPTGEESKAWTALDKVKSDDTLTVNPNGEIEPNEEETRAIIAQVQELVGVTGSVSDEKALEMYRMNEPLRNIVKAKMAIK